MVELEINGRIADLEFKGNEIKYTKQIADILDIASVSSSYTNSFTIPKTPNNVQIMQGLGIIGDTSSIPYVKTKARIKNNGFDIVRDGFLNISETSENYKIAVIDGIVELFKSMENKTIGVDLDLSNFNHEKNIETVVDSYNNEYYKYIISDYGGLNVIRLFFNDYINIDYQTPSFSVEKLLELIFQTFGYSVDFSGIQDFISGLFITYPQATSLESSQQVQSAVLKIGQQADMPFVQDGNLWRVNDVSRNWSATQSVVTEGTLNQYRYVIAQSAVYIFKTSIQGYAHYKRKFGNNDIYRPIAVRVYVNNIIYSEFASGIYEPTENTFTIFCNVGDVVSIQYVVFTNIENEGTTQEIGLKDFHFNFVTLDVKRTSQGNISLTNAMKSFKITDFLKEIIWRTAVTPYFDEDRVVRFLKIEERLGISNSVPLPGKFIKRTSEKYIRSNYAQDNIFQMKYNNEGQDNFDGHIYVNNSNIEASKTLATSQLYAPENSVSEILDLQVPLIKMWNKEPKEDADGNITIEYKALDNRFYFLRYKNKSGTYRFRSQSVIGTEIVSNILYANVENTLFSQTVPKAYRQYQKMFEQFRAHTFEIALSLNDILNIDLKKVFYSEDESKYYLINKIDFQEGEISKAECVACIPYTPQIISITQATPIGGGDILINFTYSGFQSPNITVEYNRNDTFWVSQSIPSASPQVITLPNNTGTYKIRLVFDEAVSNTVTVNFI